MSEKKEKKDSQAGSEPGSNGARNSICSILLRSGVVQ
jgi:hypothetical protein